MCGIFGVAIATRSTARQSDFLRAVRALARDALSRGTEASGVALYAADEIVVLKRPVSIVSLLASPEFADLIERPIASAWKGNRPGGPIALFGHARMTTHGSEAEHLNNQPVVTDRVVGIHNGIVTNEEALRREHPALPKSSELDSEIIFALMDSYDSRGPIGACARAFGDIRGASSIAAFTSHRALVLATNNGSLYYSHNRPGGALLFASERFMLDRHSNERWFKSLSGDGSVEQLRAKRAISYGLDSAGAVPFPLDGASLPDDPGAGESRSLTVLDSRPAAAPARRVTASDPQQLVAWAHERYPHESADSLLRCSRCLLPESMPFIAFDTAGVCNYCRDYLPVHYHGEEKLRRTVDPHRRNGDRPECVVGLSGGRDSCYALHYVTKVLNLTAVAYTYDWGMVTDLARRNIARICGELGVEHILVSADIRRKRSYIKKNVEAWLNRPVLGMIPLFMAGDKAYFYYAKKVQAQVGVDLSILGENMLERTDFKSGCAGVRPNRSDRSRVYTIPAADRIRLSAFYLRNYAVNPAYINVSLADSALAFLYYYFMRKPYINLFNFVEWKEEEIVNTITREYGWELASDTVSTWRIGDGTAAFYNFIYHHVLGFTENDTLRSNQIREGLLSREQAARIVAQENRPRFEAIEWYCRTVGLDFKRTVERIKAIPRWRE